MVHVFDPTLLFGRKEDVSDVGAGTYQQIDIGQSTLGCATATGSAEGEGESASWDLDPLESAEELVVHLLRPPDQPRARRRYDAVEPLS